MAAPTGFTEIDFAKGAAVDLGYFFLSGLAPGLLLTVPLSLVAADAIRGSGARASAVRAIVPGCR